MARRRRTTANEQGESLLELLIAVAIMGIAVVSVIAGLATSIIASDLHRKQSTAGATVRDFGEAIENYVVNTAYTSCATTSTYSPATIGYSPPSGYIASITAVTYWSGTSFVGGS
jgi:type II secretory pathway pseudopilin PulG